MTPLRPRILCVVLSLAAPLAAHAVPPRSGPAPASIPTPARAADVVVLPRGGGGARAMRFDPARSCATSPTGIETLLREHATRGDLIPLPSPGTKDIGDIAVLEDDGTFFYTDGSGNPRVDLQEVSRAFYRSHTDDYDALAVFLPSGMSDWLGSTTAFAASFVVRNDVAGLNLPPFDESAGMGSAGRLQVLLSMNGLDRYLDDPNAIITAYGLDLTGEQAIGHEFSHRWGAYVQVESLGTATNDILGRDYAHWSFFFDSDASVLEGCDWVPVTPDSFWVDEVEDRYGRLDQYLMGVRKPADVGSLLLVTQAKNIQPAGTYTPYSIPTVGVGCNGVARWFTVDDVIAANGPRVPAAPDTVPVFHVAFVLAIPRGTTPSATDLARLDSLRADFTPWFQTATDGLGGMDTRLAPTAPRIAILHTPLKDTEDTGTPRPVGARIFLAGGNLPVTLDPSSIVVRWRALGASSFTDIPMSAAGPDSFAAILPAFAGDAEYAIDAATSPPLVTATLPDTGTLSFRYHAGPDLVPPVVRHLPVPWQIAWRLPQPLLARVTDNLGVDSVWVEYAVNGGSLQGAATTRVGADSFQVALGSGLTRGSRLAYRFVARDSSAAGNVGWSNPGFDTLVVERDMYEDFENGAPLWHSSAGWSYRDMWHPEVDPLDPGRGTGMHAGASDGGPYPPHLDSALYTPFLYGIPTGAVLQFDHRFGLENADSVYAYDGAFLEYSVNGGPYLPLVPESGYPMLLATKVSTVTAFTPVWSGDSHGWRTEFADLAPLGTGPAIVRWHMVTDEFIGRDGWRLDHVRITWPDGTMDVPLVAGPTGAPVWPNPARGALTLAVPGGVTGDGAWELYDVAGRRVATLWHGRFGTAGAALRVAIPHGVAPGLYFARLSAGSRVISSARVAVMR